MAATTPASQVSRNNLSKPTLFPFHKAIDGRVRQAGGHCPQPARKLSTGVAPIVRYVKTRPRLSCLWLPCCLIRKQYCLFRQPRRGHNMIVTKTALILSVAGLLGLAFSATATAGAIQGASASPIMALQAPTSKYDEPCGRYSIDSRNECCSGNETYTLGQVITEHKTVLRCEHTSGAAFSPNTKRARWVKLQSSK